jgi:GT2 family glycosyltransferase
MLIDNASTDGSADAVRGTFPGVTVIANADNKGFAAANNQGVKLARGRYLLLLNPDTEVYAETLSQTLVFAEANPSVGVIGCRVFGDDGKQQSTLFRTKRVRDVAINTFVPNRLMRRSRWLGRCRYSGIDLDVTHSVEIVAGCFMFVRREAYEQVGGMDEAFFMYGEEAEWCHRFRKHGWEVQYCPGASILHYGGVSTDRHPTEMNLAMARSNLLLVQKTRGKAAAYLANFFMLIRDVPRAIAWMLLSPLPREATSATMRSVKRAADRSGLHLRGLFRLDWNP